jgi:hypothetical protein
VNTECPAVTQDRAVDTRNNLFLYLINNQSAYLLPQAVSNFRYFLSGHGDTVVNPVGYFWQGYTKTFTNFLIGRSESNSV